MANASSQPAPSAQVAIRAAVPAALTWALVTASFLLPLADPGRTPFLDLTGPAARLWYWLAESGGTVGAPVVAALMLAVLVTRPDLPAGRRASEAAVVALLAATFAGGGAALNEHLVKPWFEAPRPNLVMLAGARGRGPLGMDTREFYALGDKAVRRDRLRAVLAREPAPVALSPAVAKHWLQETGYSFPSGHAFSAMFLATFFLALAASLVRGRRLWVFYALLPWALAVCYSRPLLRVHTPADITVGGLQGLALALLAVAIARVLIGRLARQGHPPDAAGAARSPSPPGPADRAP